MNIWHRRLSLLALTTLVLASPLTAAAKDGSAALNLARQLNEAFVAVAAEVSPAVVVIDIAPRAESGDPAAAHPWLEYLPEEWRERFRNERRQRPRRGGEYTGEGSGMVISKDGYILTNNHVVEDAEKIRVRLKDGRQFEAEVRGTDPQSDLAVLRLKNPPKDLPVVRFGDSDKVRVGEFAIAIGAPFRLEYTVTFGHISAKGRSDLMGGMLDQDFLQTDANINPGNSGGPLINLEGEVIGINAMIRGLNSGIGFAIPSNLAREITDRLTRDGKFVRSWLGIGIAPLRDDEQTQALVGGLTDGVVVNGIKSGGPASKATPALLPSDVIVAVDGRKVATPAELRGVVTRKAPGSTVTLEVRRRAETLKIKVSPEPFPEEPVELAVQPRPAPAEAEAMRPGALGLEVEALPAATARKAEVETGVFVASVEADSLAADHGVKAGDIITEVNHRPVTSPDDFTAALNGANLSKGLLLNLVRDGQSRLSVLKERAK